MICYMSTLYYDTLDMKQEYFNDSLPAPFSKGPMAHVITIDLGQ